MRRPKFLKICGARHSGIYLIFLAYNFIIASELCKTWIESESMNNNYLDKLLYTNQHFFGLHGIYPPELLITLSTKEPTSDYLDITMSSRDDNGRSPLKTTFYNKFSKPEFAGLALIRYTHNSSNLAKRIKNNIFTG